MNSEQTIWLNNAITYGGSFIRAFAMACFAADQDNFSILEPVLNALMVKYPRYFTLGREEQ